MPEKKDTHLNIGQVGAKLKPFFQRNSTCKLVEGEADGTRRLLIIEPWGDKPVAVAIPDNVDAFAALINPLALPERYSAIYHSDTKDLEFIWTAYPLGDDITDMLIRKFEFQHRGQTYKCEYGPPRDRLVEIAGASLPLTQSQTQWRNLPSFRHLAYVRRKERPDDGRFPNPICFWLRGLDWQEDAIISLVSELNFYMTYFDHRSATVTVHTPALESLVTQPQIRFRTGKFPNLIKSRELHRGPANQSAGSYVTFASLNTRLFSI